MGKRQAQRDWKACGKKRIQLPSALANKLSKTQKHLALLKQQGKLLMEKKKNLLRKRKSAIDGAGASRIRGSGVEEAQSSSSTSRTHSHVKTNRIQVPLSQGSTKWKPITRKIVPHIKTKKVSGEISNRKLPTRDEDCKYFVRTGGFYFDTSAMADSLLSKTGSCARGKNCKYRHDPCHRRTCVKFLKGECKRGAKCLLRHTKEKSQMPVCRNFLFGFCDDDNCIYSHVRVNPDAPVCPDFQKGRIREAALRLTKNLSFRVLSSWRPMQNETYQGKKA